MRPLFLCLFSSILTSKRCENEEMTVREKDNGKKKKRWWGCGISCFGDPNVYDSDGTDNEFTGKPVRKKVLSRIIKKKRTVVPIEIENAMDRETKRRNSDEETENSCEEQSKPEEKQPKLNSPNITTSDAATLPVQNMTSNSEYLSQSAPLCRTLYPVSTQTQLRTSNCNSPVTSHHSTPEISPSKVNSGGVKMRETDPSKIIPVIAVAAILFLLFGRVFAIFSMCVYFYIVSKVKSDAEKKDQRKTGNKDIDLTSNKHKQTVVLRGFLERGMNKPASSLI